MILAAWQLSIEAVHLLILIGTRKQKRKGRYIDAVYRSVSGEVSQNNDYDQWQISLLGPALLKVPQMHTTLQKLDNSGRLRTM